MSSNRLDFFGKNKNVMFRYKGNDGFNRMVRSLAKCGMRTGDDFTVTQWLPYRQGGTRADGVRVPSVVLMVPWCRQSQRRPGSL